MSNKIHILIAILIFYSSETYALDTVRPIVTSVEVISDIYFNVTFSEPVHGAGYTTSYALSGSGKGSKTTNPQAVLKLDQTNYQLVFSFGEMVDGGNIIITASSLIEDDVGNPFGTPNSDSGDRGAGVAATPLTGNIDAAKSRYE